MGAAGAKWDEAKHFRGYHGRFAAGSDRSPEVIGGVRSSKAFHPPVPAQQRRAMLQRVRDAVRVFNRDPATLSWKERQRISWASPNKMAEQRAKTGDIRMPRREGMVREAAVTGGRRRNSPVIRKGGHRTEIVKNPRTGKVEAKRGTREVVLADGTVKGAKRAHRMFEVGGSPAQSAPAAPAPSPQKSAFNAALTSDSRLKDIARSLGIAVPPRAGRNQIIKLIEAY